jgi:RNA methyltransferase, TrmH family
LNGHDGAWPEVAIALRAGMHLADRWSGQAMTNDKERPSPWSRARPGGNAPRDTLPARDATAGRAPPTADERKQERARAYIEEGRPRPGASRPPAPARAPDDAAPRAAERELRLYGLNACLAAFANRPDALRKVYLTEARIPALKAVLAWCVKQRIGYRVVAEADLDKLAASRHHEGVCFDLRRTVPLQLEAFLAGLPAAPSSSLLLWLDGVGNPHNLGALLRSAAHFGVQAVIVPRAAGLDVSGAAARVAEGAAEVVPLVQAEDASIALALLRAQGYALAATVPRDGASLYACALPGRLVLAFGAEGEGIGADLAAAADLRLSIPGSGAIDSLNVAASVAVLLGEYWRQHGAPPSS